MGTEPASDPTPAGATDFAALLAEREPIVDQLASWMARWRDAHRARFGKGVDPFSAVRDADSLARERLAEMDQCADNVGGAESPVRS